MGRPRKQTREPDMMRVMNLVAYGFNITHAGRPENDFNGSEYIMQLGEAKNIFKELAEELGLEIR